MIYQKLSEIQKRLFVPKGQRNGFGNYNYRSCEDIFKAVKPICDDCGCVLTVSNDMEQIGDRNYVKATVTLVELETGDKIESTAHAREEKEKKGMDGSQITGAASSYARKYALAGMFCIDNEKDSDATNQGDCANRALGMCGFGIDNSVASYEEVGNAIKQQEQAEQKLDEMTVEDAEQLIIPFGKYKGESLGDIMSENENYIAWLSEYATSPDIQKAAKLICDEHFRELMNEN